jgi:hypothetical protein
MRPAESGDGNVYLRVHRGLRGFGTPAQWKGTIIPHVLMPMRKCPGACGGKCKGCAKGLRGFGDSGMVSVSGDGLPTTPPPPGWAPDWGGALPTTPPPPGWAPNWGPAMPAGSGVVEVFNNPSVSPLSSGAVLTPSASVLQPLAGISTTTLVLGGAVLLVGVMVLSGRKRR